MTKVVKKDDKLPPPTLNFVNSVFLLQMLGEVATQVSGLTILA